MSLFENKLAIHTSDRRVYKRCKRKYMFSSLLERGLQPRKPNTIFWLGTGVHHALQLYYESFHIPGETKTLTDHFEEWSTKEMKRIEQSSPTPLYEEDRVKFDEAHNMGKNMLNHYAQWCLDKDNFTPYKMEVMFSLPIVNPDTGESLTIVHPESKKEIPVMYEGRFDGIVQDKEGHYWVLEHKTAKNFGDWDNKLDMDEQITSYIWAAEYLYDIPVKGVIYNGLRKKSPVKPSILKSGSLSKNKAIDTTKEIYLQTIKENNLDEADYQDILSVLENKGNTFFRREYVQRSSAEIVEQQSQIFYEALDMLGTQHFYPNPTRDCCWDCDFKEACSILQARGNVEPTLEAMYEPRPKEEDEFDESVGK